MSEIADFRADTRAWLEQNCPPGARGPGEIHTGSTKVTVEHPDTQAWMERMAERGWSLDNIGVMDMSDCS